MRNWNWRIILSMILAVVLLTMGCAFAETVEGLGLKHDVLVLFTSDVHCAVDKGFGYAGLQMIRDAALAKGDHVVLVDNGDSIQGDSIGLLKRGLANIELMNALHYDVAVPGNHEFDYGMNRFLELKDIAEFPYISCNFMKEDKTVLDPYIIKEFDGVKIAFVGACTPATLRTSTPRNFQDGNGNFIYNFCQDGDGSHFYSVIQSAVDAARAEGAQYVFLTGHLGNEASASPFNYADVISHITGIDGMMDGHSHDTDKVVMKDVAGKDVARQACGTQLSGIGWVRISAGDGSVDTGLYNWNNSTPAPEVLGIWNEMRNKVEIAFSELSSSLNEIVGVSRVNLIVDHPTAVDSNGKAIRIARMCETNLGDLCADALRYQMGADVCILNSGSLRAQISKGDVAMKDVIKMFPFGKRVCLIEVTGQQILDALEYGSKDVPEENGAFMQVSGITYEIHTYIKSSVVRDDNGMFAGVKGEYRVKNVEVNGEPLDPGKTYTLSSVGYLLLDDGDGLTTFRKHKLLAETDVLDYELVANYIRDNLHGVIGEEYEDLYGNGRIVIVEKAPEDK